MEKKQLRKAYYTAQNGEKNFVLFHGFFQVCAGTDDSGPVAVVENTLGDVMEVAPGRIQFIVDDPQAQG